MKFCDKRIQEHLLNGGKIKRTLNSCVRTLHITKQGYVSYEFYEFYTLTVDDLTSNDWEIVEPEYDWDKIIKDKILCIFSDYKDFRTYVISPLIKIEDTDCPFMTIDELVYYCCKPFNPADFNIAKDLKEYEK